MKVQVTHADIPVSVIHHQWDFCIMLLHCYMHWVGIVKFLDPSFATLYDTGPTRCLCCVGVGQMFHSGSSRTEGNVISTTSVGAKEKKNCSNFQSESASLFHAEHLCPACWASSRLGMIRKRTSTARSTSIGNLILQEVNLQSCRDAFSVSTLEAVGLQVSISLRLKSRFQAVRTQHRHGARLLCCCCLFFFIL